MNLEFFKFFSWTALWAWVLSDTAVRFVLPLIDKFHNILGEITKTSLNEEKSKYYFMKTIALSLEFIFSICFTYVLTSWTVWCVLRCVLYTQGMVTNRWPFFIAGFLCCELALAHPARASTRKNFLGVLPYILAMGAFMVFSLNYDPIRTTFPWIIKFVGLESL